MNVRIILLFAAILGLGVVTVFALADVGYLGIFQSHLRSWAGGQVLLDLVIACLLACVWMAMDARKSGVPAWPFILLTLAGGSFGPLFYLVAREWRTKRAAVAA